MAHALRHLTGWLALVALAVAAPQPAARVLSFGVFAARPIPDLGVAVRPGAPPRSVQLYPTARSPRQEFSGPMPIRFVDTKSGATLAEATVPPEIREPLLVLLKETRPGARLPYQVIVFEDSAAGHPAGSCVVVNLSGLALAGTLNGKPLTVQSGLNPPVGGVTAARLTLKTRHKDRDVTAYAGDFRLGRNQRALLLLLPPVSPGSLQVQWRLLLDEPGARRDR